MGQSKWFISGKYPKELWGYSDANIVVKKTIDLLAAAAAKENGKAEKDNAYKNNALFR